MDERAGLLQAIIDTPDDDTPRLVYADWLDEHGQSERAEFIRVQCAMVKPPFGNRAVRLYKRERALLDAHRAVWLEEVPPWARGHAEFSRGFVETVRFCPVADWLAGAEDLLRSTPLRELHLVECSRRLKRLADSPSLARVRSLDLSQNNLRTAGARTLAGSPYLTGLRKLDIDMNDIGPAGIRALAESPHLSNLTELSLAHNNVGSAGAEAIAESSFLGKLEALNIQGNKIGPSGTAALSDAPFFVRLTDLDVGMNDIGDEGVIDLAWADAEGPPLRLHLYYDGLFDAGVEELAGSALLARVIQLDLCGNFIEDEGASALIRSEHLKKIEEQGGLDLSDNPLTRQAESRLRKRFGKVVNLVKEE